jgi:hypothetical protein
MIKQTPTPTIAEALEDNMKKELGNQIQMQNEKQEHKGTDERNGKR